MLQAMDDIPQEAIERAILAAAAGGGHEAALKVLLAHLKACGGVRHSCSKASGGEDDMLRGAVGRAERFERSAMNSQRSRGKQCHAQ